MAVQLERYYPSYINDENAVFLRITDTENESKLPKLVTGYKGKLLEGSMCKSLTMHELKAVNNLLLGYKNIDSK